MRICTFQSITSSLSHCTIYTWKISYMFLYGIHFRRQWLATIYFKGDGIYSNSWLNLIFPFNWMDILTWMTEFHMGCLDLVCQVETWAMWDCGSCLASFQSYQQDITVYNSSGLATCTQKSCVDTSWSWEVENWNI